MRALYAVLSGGLVLLGVVHVASAPRLFDRLSAAALWFASGGLAIALTGALNLLRQAYGHAAPGLRRVCVAANVVMTGFAALSAYASRAPAAQVVGVLALVGGATLCSLLPGAQRGGPPRAR
jgi:hypothetical protein